MQPTLCSRCKKNVAVIFITRIENGESHNEGLCLRCARELHIKPGQTKDMIPVVVGQTDGVCAHQVHPGAAGSGLGALAAVQQQAVPAALRHSGGQGALRQRHGSSRAQQCNGQHKQFLRGSSLLSYHKPRRCTILSAAA